MNNAELQQRELEKFSNLAATWWDVNGPMQPLHAINPLRLQFIKNHVADLREMRGIDVGCGGGILTEALAMIGVRMTGIDANADLIQVANAHRHQSHLDIEYQQTLIEEYALNHANAFELVTCMELLEHVPDPQAIITACSHMLKPGGHVFFSTLNRNLIAYIKAILGAEYVLGLLPRGTHDYKQFIKPAELDHSAREAGLRLCALTGIGYNPFTKTYALTGNIDTNYIAYYVKD